MNEPVKRQKRKRREQGFCTDLTKELQLRGWAFKIPDTPSSIFMEGKGRFNPPKKFDIISCSMRSGGRLTAIEAKMWKLKRDPTRDGILAILRKRTEKHEGQLDSLRTVALHSGLAFIVLKRFIPRASQYWLVRCNDYDIDSGKILKFFSVRALATEIINQR